MGLTSAKAGTYRIRLALKTTFGGKPGPEINREISVRLQ